MIAEPRELVYSESGPNTEPWGTPVSSKQGLDKEPFHVTWKMRFVRYDVNQVRAESAVPSSARMERRIWCLTASNADTAIFHSCRKTMSSRCFNMAAEICSHSATRDLLRACCWHSSSSQRCWGGAEVWTLANQVPAQRTGKKTFLYGPRVVHRSTIMLKHNNAPQMLTQGWSHTFGQKYNYILYT